ncbi:hypothetical protein ElyMa_002878700, partial [Elysia marginata]
MHTCIRCAILADNAGDRDGNTENDKVVDFLYYSKHLGITLPSFDQKRCTIQVGTASNQIIDLSRLARRDGKPRFRAKFNISAWNMEDLELPPIEMNYAFNPCVPYTFEVDHNEEPLGPKNLCKDVTLCKYIHDTLGWHLYPLSPQVDQGSPTSEGVSPTTPTSSSRSRLEAVFVRSLGRDSSETLTLSAADPDTDTAPPVALVYSSRLVQTSPAVNTTIHLVCNENLTETSDAIFRILSDNYRVVNAELHHMCCCLGMCVEP